MYNAYYYCSHTEIAKMIIGELFSIRFILLVSVEVFTKLARNEIFHTKPATLHFEGFYVGKAQKKTLVCTYVQDYMKSVT